MTMKIFYILLLAILTTSNLAFSQQKALTINKLEIPRLKPQEIVINHYAYSLSYNEPNEQANWVAYELTSDETNSTFSRSNKFIEDPLVKTGTAGDKDYSGSGYDKGHLAPAADMSWSASAMKESFYYSNMSPQDPSFNRGVWKRIEELVRAWAKEYKSVYVVTGPVLTSGLKTIGYNQVSVPKYYYKVILEYNKSGIKGIGFVIPNTGSQESLQHFAVNIDSVEKITGIDFFPLLPDVQEKSIESNLNVNEWTWKSFKSTAKKVNTSNSVQCSGITKKGTRCKNKTTNANGRCHLH